MNAERIIDEQEIRRADFLGQLRSWTKNSGFLSGSYVTHPLFEEKAKEVLSFGKESIPWYFEELRRFKNNGENYLEDVNPWLIYEALSLLPFSEEIDSPVIPEEAQGRLFPVLEIMDDWGVKMGYLEPQQN